MRDTAMSLTDQHSPATPTEPRARGRVTDEQLVPVVCHSRYCSGDLGHLRRLFSRQAPREDL